MRSRLRYFRLFGLMTIVFVMVLAVYMGAKSRTKDQHPEFTKPILESGKQIVVAATDLMPRTLITPEVLEEKRVKVVPFGAFTAKEQLVNRLTLTPIRKGEPIFQQHVTPPLEEVSAAYLVPPGQVGIALTIPRPETLPPLRAGDYISIHAVFAGMKVKTIVPRAMVLAVNNRIGEISLIPSRPSSQQASQQTQPPPPESEKMNLFVALSPKEAKFVALAIDSGATLYYTLHSKPLSPLFLPELERDLTLSELTGSPQIAAIIARKQHGELPQSSPINSSNVPPPSQPPTSVSLQPVIVQLDRIDRSIQSLNERVQKLEKQAQTPQPTQRASVPERRIIGVVGDQTITFVVPRLKDGGVK